MSNFLLILSIVFGSLGLSSIASALDSSTNELVKALENSGLSQEEILKLNELSINNPTLFERAVQQDLRIKGPLKIEVLATANKGGGPCISGSI